MPQHARFFWWRQRGRTALNLSWDVIRRDSVVVITASEGDLPTTTQVARRFVGAANFTVSNVAPRDGAVTFVVNIDWPSPLNLWTYITVFDRGDPQLSGSVPFPFP